MPKFRAGAYDRGSKTKGKYTVVNANSVSDAMVEVKKYFPTVPMHRIFAREAEIYDKVDNTLHDFSNPKKKGAQ